MSIRKESINFFQIECYCLESPVSCSILPSENLKSIRQNQFETQPSSQPNVLQLTLWDQHHQMQNYLVYDQNFRNQEALKNQGKILKNGNLQSHKFGIKKAYCSGNYFIILDEDNIVTVRKQWQIQQCFTEIQDIVPYQQCSTNNIQQRNLNSKQINSQTNYTFNSTIFILNQNKSLSKTDKSQQKFKSQQSELIVLIIQQNSSLNNKDNDKTKQAEEVQYKSVKLNTKSKLTLSRNAKWALFQNCILSIQVNIPRQKVGLSQTGNELGLILRQINLDFLYQKTHKQNTTVFHLERVNQNQFYIVYLNDTHEICRCSFNYACKDNKAFINSFTEGDTICSTNQKDFQNLNFIICHFSNPLQKWEDMMFLIFDHSLQIYSVDSLKLISKIPLSSISDYPISQNCEIIYAEKSIVWIFDRTEISLHKFDLQRIVSQQIVKPLIGIFNPICEDISKSHINTSKLLNLRLKILKLLKSYLQGDNFTLHTHSQGRIDSPKHSTQNDSLKYVDFSSCVRLLNKQQNISILNDGVSYLIRYMLNRCSNSNNLQSIISKSVTIKNLEESLVKLLSRLVLSKYESHVQNGLDLLLKTFKFFNSKTQSQNSKATSLYNKIVQSSRIQKLLQQQKKQKLWELAYTFSLKIQGSIE